MMMMMIMTMMMNEFPLSQREVPTPKTAS